MKHTGLSFLFTCQPTKSSNFSRLGVNVRAHLLRKNYSRNFSSIRSAPLSFTGIGKSCLKLRMIRVANMSFNAIRENKILAKIFELTVLRLEKHIMAKQDCTEINQHMSRDT